MSIGKSIVTADGIRALAIASASGLSIKPKYFKFSNQDLEASPTVDKNNIHAWLTKDIDLYQVIDNETIEFVCDIEPTKAVDYTRFVGLYLEDGTLFMVAKPPYPFPPSLRQTFKIQMTYQNANGLVDFKYISHAETEQSLSILDTSVTLGLEAMQNAKENSLNSIHIIAVIKRIKELTSFEILKQKQIEILEEKASKKVLEDLDTNLSLGLQIIQNSVDIGFIKQIQGVN